MKSFSHIILFLLLITFSNRGVVAQESPDTTVQITSESIPACSELRPEELSEKASEAYRRQDYRESTALYEALVAKGIAKDRISAQLYYNLGNAYFRDNQLGKAILNYERALLLDPGDSDIRHNLRFANNRKVDRIIPAGDIFLSNWFKAVRNLYSSNTWAALAIISFIIFLISLSVYLFVRLLWARKTAFYSAIVLFILVIIFNIFSFSQNR